MHGAGNDYVYVDARGKDAEWPAVAVAISDRHTGIGSDGLILLLQSDSADFRMRMFNADGSEGEMCGNGIRCLARFAVEHDAVSPEKSPMVVETAAGNLEVMPLWHDGEFSRARVSMGLPGLAPHEIPVIADAGDSVIDFPITVDGREFKITCVSMGNPHAVAFIKESVDDVRLDELGPLDGASSDVSSTRELRNRERSWSRTPSHSSLGARLRTYHGLRYGSVRRGRGRPDARVHRRQVDRRTAGRRPDNRMAG